MTMTKKRTSRSRSVLPVLMTALLIVMLLAIGVGVASFALSWLRGSLTTPGSIVPGLPSNTQPSENVKYEFGAVLPTWTGKDRITLLLLGIDERSQETGPFRTDTMMVLTLDPVTQQGGVLSIPRDLWVPIPGYQDGRINTAHFLGDLYGYTGGGPALAEETVEYNLGIQVDYYVRVNFQGFVTLVNAVGGINIYVEAPISDPTYPDYNYGYEPLSIDAGWQHFDGEMALKYARTRHGSSDFDRARRQQQVMLAVLNQVIDLNMAPTLARNASELYKTLQASVQTNLALDQILALANLVQEVDRSQIRFGVIDSTCTQPWVTPEGWQVLVPLRDQMRTVRDYVFFTDQPQATGSVDEAGQPLPTATPEIATISVLNGTAQAGLAGGTGDYLSANGLMVANVGNAEGANYAKSLIIMNRDKSATANRIATLLGMTSAAIVHGTDANAAHDIVVILGADYAGPP